MISPTSLYAFSSVRIHVAALIRSFDPELLKPLDIEALLEVPPKPELGEFAFPCFALSAALKKKPGEIAQALLQKLDVAEDPLIEKLAAAGPYVNIRLRREAFSRQTLEEVFSGAKDFGKQAHGTGQTVVIDYSSPNIAKHLAFHHLRSAVIGKALCEIFRAMGYKVIGINHVGDWGTQFGKLITAYLKWGPKDGNLGEDPVTVLNDLYIRFQKEAKDDPKLLDEAREWFKKLEAGNPEAKKLWERFREVSIDVFADVYRRLDVKFDETSGESFFVDQIPGLLKKLESQGLTKISEGALIVDLEAYNMPPCLLKKADEASLYATRDLCAAIYRAKTYHFAHMLYVVDTGQSLHFKQFFKVLELMHEPWANKLEHINFGIIKFAGAKTRTREGNIILLSEVLDEAVQIIKEKITEKNPDLKDKETVAKEVGIGAIIFADLCSRRVRDINFDWKEILNFDGRTGPYVQYSHARAHSILRKAPPEDLKNLHKANLGLLKLEEEWRLVFELSQFPQAIAGACREREPSFIADAILSICEHFHRYHTIGKKEESNRVLTADGPMRLARLYLTHCTVQVLENGLKLLGMKAPHEM